MSYDIKGRVIGARKMKGAGVMNSDCSVKIMMTRDIDAYLKKYKVKSTHLLKYVGEV